MLVALLLRKTTITQAQLLHCRKKYKYSGMPYQTVIAAMGICKYRRRMHETPIEAQKELHRCKKNPQPCYGQ
jgi:hypothetical protein